MNLFSRILKSLVHFSISFSLLSFTSTALAKSKVRTLKPLTVKGTASIKNKKSTKSIKIVKSNSKAQKPNLANSLNYTKLMGLKNNDAINEDELEKMYQEEENMENAKTDGDMLNRFFD